MIDFTITSEQELYDFNSSVKDGLIKNISLISSDIISFTMDGRTLKLQFDQRYLTQIDYGLDEITKLIYGKIPLSNVVNISYKNENIHIFTEKKAHIQEIVIPYKFWVLSNFSTKDTNKLKGNTHYKHIKFYKSEQDYLENKSNFYKYRLFNINHVPEAFMTLFGVSYFKDMKPNDPSILSFDIETASLDPNDKNAEVFLITNTFRKNGLYEKKTFNLKYYHAIGKTDSDMIDDWCDWVRQIDPSIMCGHNIVIFDLPYLEARSNRGLKLGRDGSIMESENRPRELRKDGSQSYSYNRKTIFGREICDTFFLAIKYDIGRKYESYALKSIIRQEGKEKPDRTFIDASKIRQYYYDKDTINWELTVKYAEDDSDDALVLYDFMSTATFYMNQTIPKTFQLMIESATGSQLNSMMVRSYLQDGFSIPQASESVEYEGAISIGVPGLYRNCIKHDVASLYPSIMVEYNIENPEKDYNHNFQKITKYLRTERLKNKKLAKDTGDRYYDDLQNTQKVAINSLYGFLGASGLNFNYPEGAAKITRYGREILAKAIEHLTGNNIEIYRTEELNRDLIPQTGRFCLVNADTDSYTVCKNDMSQITEEENEKILQEINGLYPNNISWEDDGSYPVFCVLKAKNYIMYDGEKIKLKGSSLKDQKKEPILKRMLDQMIEDIIEWDGSNLLYIYHEYIREAKNPQNIKDWCQKKTVTKPILACATNPEARKNERVVYDAISNKQVQEGDKIYLYPCVFALHREETVLKNGKIKVKEIKETGLKCAEDYNNDADTDKLIDRVYSTVLVFSNIVGEDYFTDYTLVKNKKLLECV